MTTTVIRLVVSLALLSLGWWLYFWAASLYNSDLVHLSQGMQLVLGHGVELQIWKVALVVVPAVMLLSLLLPRMTVAFIIILFLT